MTTSALHVLAGLIDVRRDPSGPCGGDVNSALATDDWEILQYLDKLQPGEFDLTLVRGYLQQLADLGYIKLDSCKSGWFAWPEPRGIVAIQEVLDQPVDDRKQMGFTSYRKGTGQP